MTCYHPLARIEYKNIKVKSSATGKMYNKYHICSQKEIEDAGGIEKIILREETRDGITQMIPCGKCIGCRLEISKQWATRCMLEARDWEHNWFVTLTYDDEHKPYTNTFLDHDTGEVYQDDGTWNGYLEPKDIKKFMHDLRQKWERKYKHTGIRYYGCGEYGGQTARPHYHMILFNLPIPKEGLKVRGINQEKRPYYQCDEIAKIWGKGNIQVDEVTWSSCAYVARYVTKKMTGTGAPEHYASKGQTPEFVRMSRMPGIARRYYDENKEKIYEYDEILTNMGIKKGARKVKPPRYYDKLYDIDENEKMEKIKRDRRTKGKELTKRALQASSYGLQKSLSVQENTQANRALKLIRPLE